MAEYDYPGSSPTFGVTLNNGDVMRIFPNGGASGVTINSGGVQYVEGGYSGSDTINSGGVQQIDSGNVDGSNIESGGVTYVNGGSVGLPTVNGGLLQVGAQAEVSNAEVENGGVETLSGSNISSTALQGGTIVLNQPGYTGGQHTDPTVPMHNLGSIVIESGGVLEIQNGVIAGVALYNGTIIVDPVHYDSSVTDSYDATTGILAIHGASGSYQLGIFDPHGGGAADFVLSAAQSGAVAVTDVGLPVCFARGTMIATPGGEVAVEHLVAGNLVSTMSGSMKAAIWIGRSVCRPGKFEKPVIVRHNALADGVPSRDLRVTPGHALLIDGVLIPAGELVNGASIVWDESPDEIEVFHIELDTHDVLVANGAPAESYRDAGNRDFFLGSWGTLGGRKAECAAPLLSSGPVVERIWRVLRERAGLRDEPLTNEADIHLVVDGRRVDGCESAPGQHSFRIDDSPGHVSLGSREVVPALVGSGRDHRKLGVALRGCRIAGASSLVDLGYASPHLGVGFHAPEERERLRWTDGAGELPSYLFRGSGPFDVTIEVGCLANYTVAAL